MRWNICPTRVIEETSDNQNFSKPLSASIHGPTQAPFKGQNGEVSGDMQE
jgi:hypothetical protein